MSKSAGLLRRWRIAAAVRPSASFRRGPIRGQEGDRLGNIVYRCRTTERDLDNHLGHLAQLVYLIDPGVVDLRAQSLFEAVGVNPPWRNQVHPDSLRAELLGQGPDLMHLARCTLIVHQRM